MRTGFDRYTYQARVAPVYIAISPLVLILAAFLPHGLDVGLGGGALIAFLPLAYLASQLAADAGKRIERHLWAAWGGPPTTRFLRHSDREFNPAVRERVHAKLRALGLNVPTKDEEEVDPAAADQALDACVQEVIRRTRSPVAYPLVLKGLTDYGFRRNLLGLKPAGLAVTLAATAACGWKVWAEATDGSLSTMSMTTLAVSVVLATVWISWVSRGAVKTAATRYARFLLEAALDLE